MAALIIVLKTLLRQTVYADYGFSSTNGAQEAAIDDAFGLYTLT